MGFGRPSHPLAAFACDRRGSPFGKPRTGRENSCSAHIASLGCCRSQRLIGRKGFGGQAPERGGPPTSNGGRTGKDWIGAEPPRWAVGTGKALRRPAGPAEAEGCPPVNKRAQEGGGATGGVCGRATAPYLEPPRTEPYTYLAQLDKAADVSVRCRLQGAACAESGRADVFLTTDDDLLRKASRHKSKLRVRVMNPILWVREVGQL